MGVDEKDFPRAPHLTNNLFEAWENLWNYRFIF